MPLHLRLIAITCVILVVSVASAIGVMSWHGAASIRTELQAALDGGRETIQNGLDELSGGNEDAGVLRRLIAAFDGNRHLRVTLLDDHGRVVAESRLLKPGKPPPAWLQNLVVQRLHLKAAIPVSSANAQTIELVTDPTNEAGEIWEHLRDTITILVVFAIASTTLTCLVILYALRPLQAMLVAFDRVGQNRQVDQVAVTGSNEMRRLAAGFNKMSARIAVSAAHNRRLNERLVNLQMRERADLARDLHDEIGPLLFSIEMNAATIDVLAAPERESDIRRHLLTIQDSVRAIQHHVRGMLQRLRPAPDAPIDDLIGQIVSFWHAQRPEIRISTELSLPDCAIAGRVRETVYRIIQEGVGNAIRHGDARAILVRAASTDTGISVEIADDGAGFRARESEEYKAAGLGLIGMRERIEEFAGSLTLRPGDAGSGVTLTAWLPAARTRSQAWSAAT